MIFKRFVEFFPETAEKETRRITIRNDPQIPDGEYAFVESFCEDKDCDCRRAYFDALQYAERFLELFESKLLIDPAYIDRIKRHYALFKAVLRQ